jgi:cytochrome c oxidase subunit 2
MINCDSIMPQQLGYQDPGTLSLVLVFELYDRIMYYLIILLIIVLWFFIRVQTKVLFPSLKAHGNLIEFLWTLAPAGILWGIGIPSLKLLYMLDEILDSEITVKAIGNQWYWSYENGDESFDSFLIDEDLDLGELRLLTVDNSLILPIYTSIRLLVTSNDVIHSFAVPSLGLKCDAIPGRLNSAGLLLHRESFFYGQCSELCGILHGFMPISIQGVLPSTYLALNLT